MCNWIVRLGLVLISCFITPISAEGPNPSYGSLKRPIVSLTFDDGWLSVYQNCFPVMKKYQYPATFFINTGSIGDSDRFTVAQIQELHAAGYEIGSHSVHHPDLNTIPAETVDKELTESKKVLETITKAPVKDFAAPFGEANAAVIRQIKKYFSSNRTVETGYNSTLLFNPYHIRTQNIKVSTTPEQVESWLDTAQKENLWLVLTYHQVDEKRAAWSTTPADFEKHLAAINKRNLTVLTMEKALEEVESQIKK